MARGFMSLKEVSEYLDFTEKMVEELMKVGQLKMVEIGGERLFSRSLIDKWIEKFVEESSGQAFKKELEYMSVIDAIPRPGQKWKKGDTNTYTFCTGKLEKK